MKLADLFIRLGLKKDGFDKGIDGAKKKTNSFSASVKKIGGFIAGAFAVSRIASFAKELIELGGIAEGVEDAFFRIADAKILEDLTQATRGTVSELELMKRAVSAQNLGLPVENLASLFEFATKRAQDTGESVDYLVNSIVTGIGRKSPLILDNLGISAIQLREKLQGVGMESASVADVAAAVGEIAADSMQKSGEIIDTNAIKIQNLAAQWENLKKAIATNQTVLNYVSDQLDGIGIMATILTSDQISGWEKLRSTIFDNKEEARKLAEELEKAAKNRKELAPDGPQPFDFSGGDFEFPEWEDQTKTISELKEETKALKDSLDEYKITQTEEIQNTLKQIDANEKLIDNLLGVGDATKDLSDITDEASASIIKSYLDIKNNAPSIDEIFNLNAPEIDTGNIANFADTLFGDEVIDELPIDTGKIVAQMNEFQSIVDSFKMGVSTAITDLSSALGEAFSGGGWDNFGEAVLQIIGGFMQQLGGLMIAYAINAALFSAAVTNPLAWPLALAAGVAMAAAGAAVSSFAAGGLGGSSAGASGYSPAGSSASTAISGNVNFVLEGDKLVGAINNNSAKRRLTR